MLSNIGLHFNSKNNCVIMINALIQENCTFREDPVGVVWLYLQM